LHLFSERKSNPKIYFLQQAENPLVEFLPVGMKEPLIFHTRFLQKSICGKQRENFSFQQKETTLSVIASQCRLTFSGKAGKAKGFDGEGCFLLSSNMVYYGVF